jgi:hypothetical protein
MKNLSKVENKYLSEIASCLAMTFFRLFNATLRGTKQSQKDNLRQI